MPERTDSQEPAIALLRDVLGYTATTGAELAPERVSLADPWLEKRLEASLVRVNPGLTTASARQAINVLRQAAGPDLLETNERMHTLLSRWVTVEEATPLPGQPPLRRSVRFFDFENPDNNEFLVTDEFVVKGPQRERRFDVTIHVKRPAVISWPIKGRMRARPACLRPSISASRWPAIRRGSARWARNSGTTHRGRACDHSPKHICAHCLVGNRQTKTSFWPASAIRSNCWISCGGSLRSNARVDA
jgi:hypothetical protein